MKSKYFLIKIEDDNYPAKVIGRTRDGGFEYIGLNAWDFVELTKEELKNLLKADARYESKDVWVSVQYIQEKIRKVLK